VRILLVGSLSWNPERVLALAERGHELYGLWGRSMAWDQGPYPHLDGIVPSVRPEDAPTFIRERGIDCVYALYQAYPSELWGPPTPAVEHELGVWDLLRQLLSARAAGAFDVPIVQHYGFDVRSLDLGVVRALDGHLVCNEERWRAWTAPISEGGWGLDAFGDPARLVFLDGDLPKAEFMGDAFSTPLSETTGELHTVCLGRPVNLDCVGLARAGIHLHVYGNQHDDPYEGLAEALGRRQARRARGLLARYLHVHASLQTIGANLAETRRIKSKWVEEFSRFDAGWSYVGAPMRWAPLDERAAIPNRLATYLLAGIPVVTERRPGFHRYELPQSLGVGIDFEAGDFEGLRARLLEEARTRSRALRARAARHDFSFDAGIPTLLAALERARERYFARERPARIAFDAALSTLHAGPRPHRGRRARKRGLPHRIAWATRDVFRWLRNSRRRRRRRVSRRDPGARRLRALLGPLVERAASPTSTPLADLPARRVLAVERFREPSRRADLLASNPGVELRSVELHQTVYDGVSYLSAIFQAAWAWLTAPFRPGLRWKVFRACLRARDVRLASLRWVPEIARRIRRGEAQELACFSAKGLEVVPILAEVLDVPCIEVLATRTQYFGEFAYELQAVVPYAYWLHLQGRLRGTVSSTDTRCLYYFSPDHREVPGNRRLVPLTEYPSGEMGTHRFDKKAFPVRLDTSRWAPPPYKVRYRDERFLWDRPTCVVCNKMSDETYLREGPRCNSIETPLLLELVDRLRTRFQVVYDRPRGTDIVNDAQLVGELGDIEALKAAFPQVLTIQELHARHPGMGFNELQLRLFAGCEHFVSVVGGSSYLASWFGGVNVVYARGGWEVECGAFDNWFQEFSGAKVVAVSTPDALRDAVQRHLVDP